MLRNFFIHKNIVGENTPPSRFLKEKLRPAKSHVSKVLFPDIGKISNLNKRFWLTLIQALQRDENGSGIEVGLQLY